MPSTETITVNEQEFEVELQNEGDELKPTVATLTPVGIEDRDFNVGEWFYRNPRDIVSLTRQDAILRFTSVDRSASKETLIRNTTPENDIETAPMPMSYTTDDVQSTSDKSATSMYHYDEFYDPHRPLVGIWMANGGRNPIGFALRKAAAKILAEDPCATLIQQYQGKRLNEQAREQLQDLQAQVRAGAASVSPNLVYSIGISIEEEPSSPPFHSSIFHVDDEFLAIIASMNAGVDDIGYMHDWLSMRNSALITNIDSHANAALSLMHRGIPEPNPRQGLLRHVYCDDF